MKKLLLTLVILGICTILSAQKLDLIVTSQHDSIACYIDTITQSQVIAKMKWRGVWVKKKWDRNKVNRYEYGVIEMDKYDFIHASSQILTQEMKDREDKKYDLLVKKDGDSIACYIDSITPTVYYIKMKSRRKWVVTHLDKEKVAHHEFRSISHSRVLFEEETSTILKYYTGKTNMRDISRNAMFLGIAFVAYTINYERLFPLGEKIGISARLGVGYDFYNKNVLLQEEVNLLVGGPKGFFELGLGHQFPGKSPGFLIIRPGVRVQSFKGFLLKAYPLFMYNLDKSDDWEWFGFVGVSLGYTF